MLVNRNHFGRQTESFEADLALPFLNEQDRDPLEMQKARPFPGIFIRAPIVEKLSPVMQREQTSEGPEAEMVVAPSRLSKGRASQRDTSSPVDIMGTLPGRSQRLINRIAVIDLDQEVGDIVAVRQDNVFGISFHPELTEDARLHIWWLKQVKDRILNQLANGDGPGVIQ